MDILKTINDLESRLSDVQIAAIRQLENHGNEEVLSLLYPLQNSENDRVGMAAKIAIYKIINRELKDADLQLNRSSEEMIAICNDLEQFKQEYEDGDFRMRMLLLKYFSMYHSFKEPEQFSEAIQNLLEEEENPFIKSFLVRILMPFKDHVDFDFIRKFLKDHDPRVRANTIEFLGYLGGIDELPHITLMLEDKNPRVVSAGVLMMRKFGKTEVIKKIKQMLLSKDRGNVLAAFFLIGKIKVKDFFNIVINILQSTDDIVVLDRGFQAAMVSESKDQLIEVLVKKFSRASNSDIKMKITNMVVKLTGKFPEDFLAPAEPVQQSPEVREVHELPFEEMLSEAREALNAQNYTLSNTILTVLLQSEITAQQKIEVRTLSKELEEKRNSHYTKVKKEDYSEQIKKLFENVIDLDIPDVKNILLLQEFNPEQYIKMLIRLILESNMKARNYCIQKLTMLKDPMWIKELEKYKDHPDNVTRFHVRKAIENLVNFNEQKKKPSPLSQLKKYRNVAAVIAAVVVTLVLLFSVYSLLQDDVVIKVAEVEKIDKVINPGKEIFTEGKIVVIDQAKGLIKIQSGNLFFELKMNVISFKNFSRLDTVRFKCVVTKVLNNFILADAKMITRV